jgi:hypothetical protein
MEDPRYEVEKIVAHRIKNETEAELMVKWTGCSEPTLVDERQSVPFNKTAHVLYHYRKTSGTREKATGINSLFHAFRILDWRAKGRLPFLVQWVGYPPEDSTWELAWRVKAFAEEMHTKYMETHPAARVAWEKKNQTGLRNLHAIADPWVDMALAGSCWWPMVLFAILFATKQ